jgi:hypothetical protein
MNTPEKIIENGYAEIMRGCYRLRQAKKYQEEYDSMGVILNLLMQDRQHLREMYNVNP